PFMDEIERIVEGLAAAGTDVVLVTLPGLFTASETPTPGALAIGHLPRFTDNPSVLAALTGRYNAALRDLARRRGLDMIDLEQWSVDALRPRDAYFLDSVHLTARGLELIGAFMAERLASRVEGVQKRKSSTGNR
ncbi:MAG: SGNH/GDSL hydrolase family protein, partial [Rhodospirillales bacterium]